MKFRILAAFIVAIVLGGIVWVGWPIFSEAIRIYFNRRTFESAAWQTGTKGSEGIRIRMVDDLLRRHNFQGLAPGQVIALLGQPDQTNFMGGAKYQQDDDLAYWLGPERRIAGIDFEWLVFRLDSQGKVKSHVIVTD